jgi:hypothetical protein
MNCHFNKAIEIMYRKTIVRPHFVMADPGVMPTYRVKQ